MASTLARRDSGSIARDVAPTPQLTCRVLGPLEVEIDGVVVDLRGRRPRRLLAALIAAGGSPVADSVLAEVVWGAVAPTNVVNALQVLVSRLRSALGPGGRHHLRRHPLGYSFAPLPDTTDHSRFSRFVNDGRRWLTEGEAQKAADAFGSALALWRGHPWPELDNSQVASSSRARLVELRELAVEELQSARLKLGDTATAVAALSEAVAQAPYRERRWELLALGLYRGGRQAHALAALRRVRELLVDELGIEPAPALRELERRMLHHDPALILATPPARPTPHLDPAPPMRYRVRPLRPLTSLVGRNEELTQLGELMRARRLVTLLGPAGVGKTRLALEHAAAAMAHGEVWLARLAEVRTPAEVAAAVAAAVGAMHLAGDPIGMCRALAGRVVVLVLDNCEHLLDPAAELALTLLAGCPELRILATSRAPLNIDGEHTLTLEPLPIREEGGAVGLLLDRVRSYRAFWQPTLTDHLSAREICTTLGGLPLAIELAAPRERVFGLPQLAAHLRESLQVLGPVPRGSPSPHEDICAAIGWSLERLSPEDRSWLLRLWPFQHEFTAEAAASVQPTEAARQRAIPMLASLVTQSLITADTSRSPTRYHILEPIRRHVRDVDPAPAATAAAHASRLYRGRLSLGHSQKLTATGDNASGPSEPFRDHHHVAAISA